MSMEASYAYALRREEARRLYLNRIRENTRSFYEKFQAMYEKMMREGLREYVPHELARVEQRLNDILQHLETDPEQARAISTELGGFITRIRPLAKEIAREVEQKAQARIMARQEEAEKTRSEIQKFWDEQLQIFSDPLIGSFAWEGVQKLKAELGERLQHPDPEQMELLKKNIAKRIGEIAGHARDESLKWQERKRKAVERESQLELVQIHTEQIARSRAENPEKIEEILTELNSLKTRLEQGGEASITEAASQLQKHCEAAEKAVLDERIRKEVVRTVVKSLKDAGFVLEQNPLRHQEQGDDYVKIVAKKPSGKRALCKIKLSGEFIYKFDQYEGKACEKDIAKFRTDLEEVYGIHLSHERVLWENPDKISRSAKPLNDPKRKEK